MPYLSKGTLRLKGSQDNILNLLYYLHRNARRYNVGVSVFFNEDDEEQVAVTLQFYATQGISTKRLEQLSERYNVSFEVIDCEGKEPGQEEHHEKEKNNRDGMSCNHKGALLQNHSEKVIELDPEREFTCLNMEMEV